LTSLTLSLADLDVASSAMPPSGLALRELRLELPGAVPTTTMLATDDELHLAATASMSLHWAMLLSDGSEYALRPAQMAPLPIELVIHRAGDGTVALAVDGRCDGVCWQLEGIAAIRDARVHATVPAAARALD
jgi:hypothetical protein